MRNMNILQMVAAMSVAMPAMAGYSSGLNRLLSEPRVPKNYPRMAVSSPEVIAAHNSAVTTRQVKRRIARPWKIAGKWDA